jgi:hypothetical protein
LILAVAAALVEEAQNMAAEWEVAAVVGEVFLVAAMGGINLTDIGYFINNGIVSFSAAF